MLRFMGSQRIGATELNRVTWVLEPGRSTLETGNALIGREEWRCALSTSFESEDPHCSLGLPFKSGSLLLVHLPSLSSFARNRSRTAHIREESFAVAFESFTR